MLSHTAMAEYPQIELHPKSNKWPNRCMARMTFPDDLLLAQVRVIRAYDALAQQPPSAPVTVLRHELVQALRGLYDHPFWTTRGTSPTGLVELRRQARARLPVSPA